MSRPQRVGKPRCSTFLSSLHQICLFHLLTSDYTAALAASRIGFVILTACCSLNFAAASRLAQVKATLHQRQYADVTYKSTRIQSLQQQVISQPHYMFALLSGHRSSEFPPAKFSTLRNLLSDSPHPHSPLRHDDLTAAEAAREKRSLNATAALAKRQEAEQQRDVHDLQHAAHCIVAIRTGNEVINIAANNESVFIISIKRLRYQAIRHVIHA
jgi:hypothetical protein